MLTSGHQLAVDFKSYESMISRLQNELNKDPTNLHFQDEINRKMEIRDKTKSEIDHLAHSLAENLRLALLNGFDSNSHLDPEKIRQLDYQTQKIQHTTDEARKEMVNVVRKFSRNYKQLTDDVASLRNQVEDVKPFTTSTTQHVSGSRRGGENSSNPAPNTTTNNEELQAIKNSLALLADRVTELHRDFIITISEDVPGNLKEAVRLIQAAANQSVQSVIESNHLQHGKTMKEFCDEYGSRIEAIEKRLSQNTLSSPTLSLIPATTTKIRDPSSSIKTRYHSNGIENNHDNPPQNQIQTRLENRIQSQSRNPSRSSTIERPATSNISMPQNSPSDPDAECKHQ